MNRGDVVLVRFPHPSGVRGKRRWAVVVQSDAYAGMVGTIVAAEVTSNLTMAGEDRLRVDRHVHARGGGHGRRPRFRGVLPACW